MRDSAESNLASQSLPFGGTKNSGYARFGGPEGLRALCNLKAVTEDRLHGLIQTSIPSLLRYPIVDPRSSSKFVSAMIDLVYHSQWGGKAKGLYGLLVAKKAR